MPKYKKSSKEKFQDFTFYASCAIAGLGTLAGGFAGATSAMVTSTVGAVSLGVVGAGAGLVGGALLGLGAFFAANAIYENREYIAMGTAFVAVAPFMALGRGLKNLKNKVFSPKKDKNKPDTPKAVQKKSSDLADNTAQTAFTKSASKNKPANDTQPKPPVGKNSPKNG